MYEVGDIVVAPHYSGDKQYIIDQKTYFYGTEEYTLKYIDSMEYVAYFSNEELEYAKLHFLKNFLRSLT